MNHIICSTQPARLIIPEITWIPGGHENACSRRPVHPALLWGRVGQAEAGALTPL